MNNEWSIMRTLLLLLALVLSSCVDKKDRMQVNAPLISRPPVAVNSGSPAEIVSLPPRPVNRVGDTSGDTAIQQNVQALVGVSVGKLSDDLIKLQIQCKALADVNAKLELKLDALAAGQAGIGNKIEQSTSELRTNISAGRDSVNSSTQFTKEMLQALQSANQTTSTTSSQWAWVLTGIVSAIGSIAIAYLHSQKSKVEAEHTKLVRAMTGQV